MNKENVLFTLCGFILGLAGGALLLGPILHSRGVVPALGSATPAPVEAAPAGHPPMDATAATPTGGDPAVMQQVLQQLATFKQRLETNPRDVEAATQLGNLYMDARKYEQAISYYEKALAIAPNPDVETDLGICYRASGDHKRALEIFRRVHSANPAHWQSRFNEAIVLMDTGEIEAARAVVAELRQKHPAEPDIQQFAELLAKIKS